jgi:hypothetical protein
LTYDWKGMTLDIVRSLRDPAIIRELHSVSDLDRARNAQHHTLGRGINQASPGDHDHGQDGKSSMPLGLLVAPLALSPGTTVGTTELVIGGRNISCIKGKYYFGLWTIFDGFVSVANDRYTLRITANDGSGPVAIVATTITFTSTTVAATPIPPQYGAWLATINGSVLFEARAVRNTGTGVLTVNGGTLNLGRA